ncbi:unnamed protein product [Brassica napus]|uniref:(rape) hypothetical protein n=1 Tax=Brassica napus TaxID=3708 RepID=A0A816RRU9_BRANA|nr:unnamed protein product [Brassica napus]
MAWWLITRERLRHQLSKNFIWKVDHDAVASIFSRSPLSNSQPLLTDADASQDNMDIKNQISDHQFLISTEDVFSYMHLEINVTEAILSRTCFKDFEASGFQENVSTRIVQLLANSVNMGLQIFHVEEDNRSDHVYMEATGDRLKDLVRAMLQPVIILVRFD